jgi:hypothetical protein
MHEPSGVASTTLRSRPAGDVHILHRLLTESEAFWVARLWAVMQAVRSFSIEELDSVAQGMERIG